MTYKINEVDPINLGTTHRPAYAQPLYSPVPNEFHVDPLIRAALPTDAAERKGIHVDPLIRAALPTDAAERKGIPLCTGVLDYFTAALCEVARVSKAGNDQHNPGQELHWARGKSKDQADTLLRHLAERGKLDIDGQRHSAKVAWRALALLQEELEAEGAPISRGSK